MHFTGTLTVGFVLWLWRRPLFLTFAGALLLVSILQFATAVVFPVAPPRYAFMFGYDLGVADIGREVSEGLQIHTLSWAYQNMNANPYAAMPSLHAAYPIVAALVVGRVSRRLAFAVYLYAAIVWFAIVYLGHHYFVDALAGAAYAIAAYVLVTRIMSTWSTSSRLATPQVAPFARRARALALKPSVLLTRRNRDS
jgi:membrane-associated phospholipid phosphatase